MACRISSDSVFLFLGANKRPIRSQKFAANSSTSFNGFAWNPLIIGEAKQNKRLVHLRRAKTVQAVAALIVSSADGSEYRKQLAESYGFKQIGEDLPENITLKQVIDTLPKEVFEIDDVKAWKSVLISVTSYALGLWMISKAPWYLLPLAWAWTGTAVTGITSLLFQFPLSLSTCISYRLVEDTAWLPVDKEEFNSSPILRKAIAYGYGPFRPWMSIAHWLIWHFDLNKFRPNEIQRVKISLACVFGFMAIGWPLIIYKAGITGWVKYWLMPWLGYHFWMSTFTMVHHTAPHIPFKPSEEWNAAQAQLNGTVHCDYPRWIEILCHNINVHIPHHISSRIPSYNLPAAHKSLQQNWGKYLNEATWNWRLMKTIMTVCHVYDKDQNYVGFDQLAPQDSLPISFLKRVMPDYA
ncbi:Omega-6 fatty acid desaturase, chloroplastic [Linum grandiflorum]